LGVNVKHREQPFVTQLESGARINVYYASQLEGLQLEHKNENISPRQFTLEPQDFSFNAKIKTIFDSTAYGGYKMKGLQFPLTSNSATMGHKLQGCTVDEILVNN
jgi:hypothetical protein